MKLNLIFYIIIISSFLSSCGNNHENEEENNNQDNLIIITQKQFESEKMSFGKIKKMQFDDIIKSNGYIISKSSGTAKISTQVSGLVKKIYCSKGQKVNKGQTLFEITGNDLIELQQNFSESSSQLKRLKSEYERIKSLFEDKIATQKEFTYAESEYKMALAKYSALKAKIQLIGLNVTKIENGQFHSSFFIKAPISGYIS
ncbi:MAG: efflux RND transporter periplasmic adaptor subunit, partial [Bacteroidota bacterium]|nr:efflux RND transporter periplasmic adaptor subunit [Bacteroidota bacterium]